MMKFSEEETNLYLQEIKELTDLLNYEWDDLKKILSEKIDLEGALLCSYMEGEEGEEYAVIVTQNKKIYDIEVINGITKKINEVNLEDIESEYPQVYIALTIRMNK